MSETPSTCCYCGVGCGVLIESDGKQVTGVRGDPAHPANFGKLCSKGSNLHLSAQPVLQQQVRALYPSVRTTRDMPLQAQDWEQVIATMADRFTSTIAQHGADSVGFYISGQLLTEDYYVFNKLAKGLIGTNNIDSNSRLCMSSAVAGYKQSLGADAPPCSYEDIDHAGVIFIAGSNTAYAHPILYRRIEAARERNPDLKVIVVDPRRTDTAKEADLHLAILPGTDVALFNGMLHICLWDDLIDTTFISEHTEGFAELKQTLRNYTPAMVAQTCGITEADLTQAAHWFAQSKATLSLYCQGLNQSTSGTAKNTALINLHLATAQIGKAGAGPFSLTGQPNAMGGREVGGMANLLSGHRDLNNPLHRAEVAALWGVKDVPAQPGKTAVELFEAVRDGSIKIIWIVCTNPAQSMPDQALIRAALEKAELVIVQEAYQHTATVAYADILLPASTWSEKSGTVTNSERRISRVRAALPAPGAAMHDWEIAARFAQALSDKLRAAGKQDLPDFAYTTPEQIWNEHRDSTRGRDLDITGLSYAILEQQGPQQWPYPQGATSGTARLYQDQQFATANGRARFINQAYRPPQEKTSPRHPFVLNTGRLRDQWHGMSRTGTVAQLYAHAPEPCIEMAERDMARRFINEGELVAVSNARGTQWLKARASDQLKSGQAFIAMHWGEEFLGGQSQLADGRKQRHLGVNGLSLSAFDPDSKQPELKYSAVNISKVQVAWQFVAMVNFDACDILTVQQRLRSHFARFDFASSVLFGREQQGILFRAAHHCTPEPQALEALLASLGLHEPDILHYRDPTRATARHLRLQREKNQVHLHAFALAGDVQAEAWLQDLLINQEHVANSLQLLRQNKASDVGKADGKASKQVCTCFNVSEDKVKATLITCSGNDKERLSLLQSKLRCGTNCGSCLPELKQLIRQSPQQNTVAELS
ncbi:MAG: molybdopterin-dependent oxidoreductase [Burkholderiales bacterium]|nr:molybdopterin-dependent oxidoreductase [Burkholderiales bacterium]